MVLAAHGRWMPLDVLRHACGVSRNGKPNRAARQYGLKAEPHPGTACRFLADRSRLVRYDGRGFGFPIATLLTFRSIHSGVIWKPLPMKSPAHYEFFRLQPRLSREWLYMRERTDAQPVALRTLRRACPVYAQTAGVERPEQR
jgi:hypothetical protein